MNELLLRLIAHMRWADRLVADALESDGPADGDAVRLFGHIASVEQLWYSRILGQPAAHVVWPHLSPSESRSVAAAHADLFEQLVRDADAALLARPIAYRNSAGHAYESPVSEIVIHTAMHGEHHRGQIARRLRAAGREPPYTDYIQYSRRDP
jgi:uncharacterized damage-inducible protein DinB